MSVTEIIAAILMLLGTVIMILGSLGVLRFGDVFLRMHAATKSGTLGIGFLLVGVALYFGEALITIKLAVLTAIYFLTSPIGAQVLAHAAHSAKIPLVKETWIDELADIHYAGEEHDHTGDPQHQHA
jgi:multicomponent Na+:H+ antiporter subunit G